MMGRRWQKLFPHVVVLAALVELMGSVSGRFVVEKSGVTVTSPKELQGKYVSAIANFGIPQYGGTMMGVVVYPKVEGRKACADLKNLGVSFVRGDSTGGLPTVALLDRGDCYFAQKVFFAETVGAAAVLVVDDKSEPLITMDAPEEDLGTLDIVNNISIPSALIEKSFGDRMKKSLSDGQRVVLNFDWTESVPHPDDRVEYEFWTNSNDECGPKCEAQMNFIKDFRGVAQKLEQDKYTKFTPHYITWYCPEPFIQSKQCKLQCIHHGKYCAPDPEQDFSLGYNGKDVVLENLRQLCVFQNTKEKNRPWVWWDYVTDFQIRCPMKDQKYNQACAEEVLKSLSISVEEIQECIGDTEADKEHPILKAEQDAQVGKDSRGDVTILPTLIINDRQYRGKLDRGAVLKALCSGFLETTDPPPCLSEDIQTNECLNNNGGCWQNVNANVTACQDTFRGRVCSCPLVHGVQLQGDGYVSCEALGQGRCNVDNGGCWQGSQGSLTFSACSATSPKGCECPEGFKGDGVTHCDDIDECKEKTACQCPECMCSNKWGGYDCECSGDLLYIHEHDTCISKKSSTFRVGWAVILAILAGLAVAGLGGYIVYKYRLRSYMDSEIRAIMAQYMPLDSQGDVHQHGQDP